MAAEETDNDTTLLKACQRDDVALAASIVDPMLERIRSAKSKSAAYAKKDELLEMLFLDTIDDGVEDTPVEAAIRLGGSGATGNAKMKLFMLQALVVCTEPVTRLDSIDIHPAHVPRLADSIHEQVIIFMARLGALWRPYSMIGADNVEHIDSDVMELWLNEMSDLPHGAISLAVTNGFFHEYPLIRTLLDDFGVDLPQSSLDKTTQLRDDLERRFPDDKDRGDIGSAWITTLRLAKDANVYSAQLAASLRQHDADAQQELSDRLQLAAATALDALGDDATYLMSRHRRGREAMRLATLEGMRVFLAQPALRGVMRRVWLGEEMHELHKRKGRAYTWSLLRYLCIVSYNLLLLPLVAATSSWVDASRNADRGWVDAFGRKQKGKDNYLLQVAYFQAFLFQGIDLALTLYLTFLPSTLPWFGATWACSAIWCELRQLRRANITQSVSENITQFGAYIGVDMFNLLDLPSLVLTAVAFATLATFGARDAKYDDDDDESGVLSHFFSGGGGGRRGGGGGGVEGGEVLHEGALDGSSDAAGDAVGSAVAVLYQGANGNEVSALAVLLMWMRQLRLLGLASNSMSDLIQMMMAMLHDIFKFLALMMIVILGFAASLAHLIHEEDIEHASPQCASTMGRAALVVPAIELLFEGALLGDVSVVLECMREAQGSTASLGVALILLFIVISILMLLNMIIAIMGQTFSTFSASAQLNGALFFARYTQDWEDATDLPPLANLLALPAIAASYALELFHALYHAAMLATYRLRGNKQTAHLNKHRPTPSKLVGAGRGGRRMTISKEASLVDLVGMGGQHGYQQLGGSGGGSKSGTKSGGGGGGDGGGGGGSKGGIVASAFGRKAHNGPVGAPSFVALQQAIENMLNSHFGEWESTATLIDDAVRNLMQELQKMRPVRQQQRRGTIEAKAKVRQRGAAEDAYAA